MSDEDMDYMAAVSPDVLLALLDRLERAEKDATRYRWLREGTVGVLEDFVRAADDEYVPVYLAHCPRLTKHTRLPSALPMNDEIDAAIDAAMRVGSGGSGG